MWGRESYNGSEQGDNTVSSDGSTAKYTAVQNTILRVGLQCLCKESSANDHFVPKERYNLC